MDSPTTLRLDEETRKRLVRIARQRRVSASEVIREAIEACIKETEKMANPYDASADLIGVIHTDKSNRSVRTGRQLKELLKSRSKRS